MKTTGWVLFVLLQIVAIGAVGWNYHEQLEREEFVEDFIKTSNRQYSTAMQTEMISWHLAAKHEGLFPECKRCKQEYEKFQVDIEEHIKNND